MSVIVLPPFEERVPYLEGPLRVFSLSLDEQGQYGYTSK